MRGDDVEEEWPGQATYEKWQAEIEQMHADYEAMDQAEYEEFMAEMDERDREQD